MVVLPRCDSRAAAGLFTEIAESFAQLDFGCGGSTFRMTLSAGIATIGQFDTAGDAIEAADQALYRRKKAGRNGVTVSEA